MAFLLVESLAKNRSRSLQISVKILELLLLSVGIISMVALMKDSLRDFLFSTFTGFWALITCMCCFSSPPTIIIAINLMVLLIFASSTFYPRRDPNHNEEITILHVDDDDLQKKIAHRESPPPPAPAPRDIVLEVTPSAPPLPLPPPPRPPPLVVETTPSRTTNPSPTLQRGGRFDATQLPSPKPLPSPSRVKANNTTLGRRFDDVSATQLPSPKPQPQPQPQPPPQPLEPTLQRGGRFDATQLPSPKTLPSPSRVKANNTSLGRWYDDVSATRLPSPKSQPPPPPLEKWKDVVTESDEGDTMEATWEAITGGGGRKKQEMMKKKRAVKKKQSSPWVGVDVEVPPRVVRRLDSEEVVPSSPKWKELRKAETFDDAVSVTRRGGLVRKGPSMSLEDFNHKVEAFISGFNNTRHKSKRSFFDIINHKRH